MVDVENKDQAMDEKNKKKGDGKTLDCCINGKNYYKGKSTKT